MDKLGRNYQLQVGLANGSTLTIGMPFTLEFDITRNTLTSANVCQVRVYNLSLQNRNQIRFNVSDYGTFRPIILKAGYGNRLVTIFTGNISQAWSVREGVDVITQIECYDGGFAFINGESASAYPAGTRTQDIIAAEADSLPFTALGSIGSFPGTIPRGNNYVGNTANILSDLTGGGFFIDNGKANALGTNEYIQNAGYLTIDANSGLLNTPVLEQTIVRFDMIFEPAMQVGSRIKLDVLTESNFNGDYKVTAVKHRGMISEAVCGAAITTGEFFYTKLLTGVQQAQ